MSLSRPGKGHFGFSPQVIDRGAQLMRQISRKLEKAIKRIFQPIEHRIECACQRYQLLRPRHDIDALMQLACRDAFSNYARHMKAYGLKPDYYPNANPRHRMNFLRLRIHQTHDVWHVMTGFGVDEFGEIGLQGFYFGQFTSGQAALPGAAFILKSVLKGRLDDAEKHVDAFCEGYCAGKRAQSLLAVRWEELWGESVESLRRRYGIEVPRCRAGSMALQPSA